jgi:hypothetical protein
VKSTCQSRVKCKDILQNDYLNFIRIIILPGLAEGENVDGI